MSRLFDVIPLTVTSRADTAIALGESVGLEIRITRVVPDVTIMAVFVNRPDAQYCAGFLKVPVFPEVPVVRSCADYDCEFDYVEDAVRSFCAI